MDTDDVTITGSIDRKFYDLYRVTSETLDGAFTVDWESGEIRNASPGLRQFVGNHVSDVTLRFPTWMVRLVPHIGYDEAYAEAEGLLRKHKFR